jgi:aminopeptidase N
VQQSRPLEQAAPGVATFIESLRAILNDSTLDPAFREMALTLPSESVLAEEMEVIDPQAIHAARQYLRRMLARTLRNDLVAAYDLNQAPGPYSPDPAAAARRGLKNVALLYLSDLDDTDSHAMTQAQYDRADNMSDRLAALTGLINSSAPGKADALERFYSEFEAEALVIDKWFSLQAGARTTHVAEVRELLRHRAFTLKNPNRARSLIFSFCNANPARFHAPDGSGYAFWAEQVIALNGINPQVAARLARTMDRWRKYEPLLQKQMHKALQRVAEAPKLSKDVLEVVTKALADN